MFRDILAKIKAEKESKEQKKEEETQKKKAKKKRIKRKKNTKIPQVEEEQQLLKIFELERMKRSVDKEQAIEKEITPQQIEKEVQPIQELKQPQIKEETLPIKQIPEEVSIEKLVKKEEQKAIESGIKMQQKKEEAQPVKEKLEEEVIEKPAEREKEEIIEKVIVSQQIKEEIQPIKEISEEKVEKEVAKKPVITEVSQLEVSETEEKIIKTQKEQVEVPEQERQREIAPAPILEKEENMDLINMEEEIIGTKAILRHNIPSPTSYVGKNYIEIGDLDEISFGSDLGWPPDAKEFMESNKEYIYEYLRDVTKHDLERVLYLVFDVEQLHPPGDTITEVVFPPYTFKDEVGTQGTRIEWVDHCNNLENLTVHQGLDGHNKILEIKYGGQTAHEIAGHQFPSSSRVGTVEFWVYFTDVTKNLEIQLSDNEWDGRQIYIYKLGKNLLYYYQGRQCYFSQGSSPHAEFFNYRWYHLKIEWGEDQRFKIWKDGVILKHNHVETQPFAHPMSEGIDRFLIRLISGATIYIDAFGYDRDPDYTIGDNLTPIEIETLQQEQQSSLTTQVDTTNPDVIGMLDAIKVTKDAEGNIIDYGFKEKYLLFKFFMYYFFKLRKVMNPDRIPIYPIFTRTMGGKLQLKFFKATDIRPRLMFVEQYKLSIFPGDYGPGRIIKTFSLMPGEETEISVKTWKKSIQTIKEASSILDSYTEEKADEFEENITNETSSVSKVHEYQELNAHANFESTWGDGQYNKGTSVDAGIAYKGGSDSTRESTVKNVFNALEKHSQRSSAKREMNIETSYERTEEVGEEIAIVRKVENLNVSRTLNFTFKQMNQEFHVLIHLTGLRIAFFNGFPGSLKEYELNQLGELIDKYLIIKPPKGNTTQTPPNEEIADQNIILFDKIQTLILKEYQNVRDYQGKIRPLVNVKERHLPGNEIIKYLRVISPEIIDGERFGQSEYVMRPDPLDVRYVDGIIISTRKISMRTDGIIVESLLGQENALDDYALQSRREKIKEDQLENTLRKAEVDKIRVGIEIISELMTQNKLDKAVEAYKEIFGMRGSLKTMTEILGPQTLELEKKLTNI